MKNEFPTRPETITEKKCNDYGGFAWHDFVTAIPTLLFVVTGWKSNGKENASMQSWATMVGGGPEDYICIISKVPKWGHMYKSLKETGVCVLNFPSSDVAERCWKTIWNNQFETDEITASGLTAEKAIKVNAPRIKECFLNIECELIWEHELFEGSQEMTVALKAVHLTMDSDNYEQTKLGRFGKNGYQFYIHCPTNPDTGVEEDVGGYALGTFSLT